MDCNRAEAERAKAIALELFNRKEYISARNLAMKAQALNPDLENITRLIATIDVYISYNVDGVVDWYKVLNLDPSADDIAIRKQYKRLALVFHPDKNTSVDVKSATEAFKFIQEAYSVLSSLETRRKYDEDKIRREQEEQHRREQAERLRREQEENLKREREEQIRREQQEQQSVSVNAQMKGILPDGFYDFGYETNSAPDTVTQSNGGSKTTSVPKESGNSRNKAIKRKATHPQSNGGSKTTSVPKESGNSRNKATKRKATQPAQDSFWTICNSCMYQYEFAKLYLNIKLLCDNCKKPFFAYETTLQRGNPQSSVSRQQN